MIAMLLTLALALTPPAHAGKLADGWKGLPYGPDTVLAQPPLPGCTPNPEPGVRWLCDDDIGGAKVQVAYIAAEGYFKGVGIFCKGYTTCSALRDVFAAAWGAGWAAHDFDTGAMADWYWRDGTVRAAWEFNRYSDKGQAFTWDVEVGKKIESIEAERARNAANAL